MICPFCQMDFELLKILSPTRASCLIDSRPGRDDTPATGAGKWPPYFPQIALIEATYSQVFWWRNTVMRSTISPPLNSVHPMNVLSQSQPVARSWLAWSCAAVIGLFAPALAILFLGNAPPSMQSATIGAPILAVGLMGAGMISAAADGRFWIGMTVGLLSGAGLVLLALALNLISLPLPLAIGLAIVIASISFSARGTLFARSSSSKGWWIALFVVAGEAAILATAFAQPDALPDWLLVLLPAQWANIAIQAALSGTITRVAIAALIALGGTAAATLLVARLWPRRWPYLIMFTSWLGLSALVYHQPAVSAPLPDPEMSTAPAKQSLR